jgi:hypothetical protein
MSKMTTYSRTDKRLWPMIAEKVERAVRSDPDAQPVSPADLSGMKPVPQVKVIRRVPEFNAGRICGAISHSYRHAARLAAGVFEA